MIRINKITKVATFAFILTGVLGVIGCEESDNLPKANKENCAKMKPNYSTGGYILTDGLVIEDNNDQEIFNVKCQILEAQEAKKSGITPMGQKLEGKDKKEFEQEMDKEIISLKEKITKLQEAKTAQNK